MNLESNTFARKDSINLGNNEGICRSDTIKLPGYKLKANNQYETKVWIPQRIKKCEKRFPLGRRDYKDV